MVTIWSAFPVRGLIPNSSWWRGLTMTFFVLKRRRSSRNSCSLSRVFSSILRERRAARATGSEKGWDASERWQQALSNRDRSWDVCVYMWECVCVWVCVCICMYMHDIVCTWSWACTEVRCYATCVFPSTPYFVYLVCTNIYRITAEAAMHKIKIFPEI